MENHYLCEDNFGLLWPIQSYTFQNGPDNFLFELIISAKEILNPCFDLGLPNSTRHPVVQIVSRTCQLVEPQISSNF